MGFPEHLKLRSHGSANESDIAKIERQIGVRLPECYRKFILESGGGYVDSLVAECMVPTPFGKANLVELSDAQGILRLLDSDITPRNFICIGIGHFGMTICLSIAGIDHGSVYALDTEMRYFWTSEKLSLFPHLDSSIVEFFRMRDEDDLPIRPWGYENCYLIAENFDVFLKKLGPSAKDF